MTRRLQILALVLLTAVPATARGADWKPDRILVPGSTPVYTLSASGRGAAVDASGAIHAVMQSTLGVGVFEIIYAHRGQDGSWSTPEVISEGNARNASLSVGPDGTVHAIWEHQVTSRGRIEYRSRSPEGVWGDIETLSSGDELVSNPVCAVDSFDRVHAVWIDGLDGLLRVAYRLRDSAGWEATQRLGSGSGFPEDPTVSSDGFGAVHLAWSERVTSSDQPATTSNREIFYARVGPEGGGIQPVRLSNAIGSSVQPFLEATADGTLHLVWLDSRSTADRVSTEVYYRRFLPGIEWSKEKRFTYDEISHSRPVVAAGARNTVNIAWEDYRHGNPEIYFRQITWETGWDRQPTRLTDDLNPSLRPSLLALPGGDLFLLWTDSPDAASFQVYEKQGNVAYTVP